MHNYECNDNMNKHVNAFVDLNGIPYLLAEYLDNRNFQQIDRSQLKSEIIVDQSESMRAIVDISVDDIGRRASDNYPAILGNTTKYSKLLKMVSDNCELLNHKFNVLRRGIVIRVDYQLENYRTGTVIRSMNESFRILDRNYFLEINPRNTNDNAIIVNFCNTMVSTINEFTHGRDPMILRITNIHMSYEMVKESPKMPRIKQSMMGNYDCYNPNVYNMENDIYNYHKATQNQHFMPGNDNNSILPPTWSMFNRFYRFDNCTGDIVIHGQEINDPMTQVALIPCGMIRVNRTFAINPGHRIIFKFCIWKNDVTIVNNATQVIQCLKEPFVNNPSYGFNPDEYCKPPVHQHHNIQCNHNHSNDYDKLLKMVNDSKKMDYKQNQVLGQLSDQISKLSDLVNSLIPPTVPPEEPPVEEPGDDETNNSCCIDCTNCDEAHEELEDKLEEMDIDVTNLQIAVDAIPDIIPISSDIIKEIVAENSQSEI